MFKKINQNNNITFIQKKIFCLIYANIINKICDLNNHVYSKKETFN
jgi:hypothetical protein